MIPFLPSVPDNSYKFLFYVGLIIIGYSFLQGIESSKNYNIQVTALRAQIDSLTIKGMIQSKEEEKLKQKADKLSKIFQIQNPISGNDSIIIFDQTLVGENKSKQVSDSLDKIWDNYKSGQFEIELLNEKINIGNRNLQLERNQYDDINSLYFTLALTGTLISILGFLGMEKFQRLSVKLTQIEIEGKEKKYRFCQSCGKNFTSIIVNGKEKNGDSNLAFCVNCYNEGEFVEPNLTLTEFKTRAESILKQQKGIRTKRLLKNKFDSLERWLTNEYI